MDVCAVCLALAYHNAQLQASAFREEFDVDSFEDLTEPNIEMIHKVCAVSVRHDLCYLTRSYLARGEPDEEVETRPHQR